MQRLATGMSAVIALQKAEVRFRGISVFLWCLCLGLVVSNTLLFLRALFVIRRWLSIVLA